MKQALVLGGTGMLAGLIPALIDRGYWVTVIARDATRLSALGTAMAPKPPTITPLALDYHDGNK
ncbi:MAG: short-chain dehydrogenase, partial [Sulfobacillus thermotolerans]|nr:short-chain dehydrogenase [Sulfobacillus thermotolerans]